MSRRAAGAAAALLSSALLLPAAAKAGRPETSALARPKGLIKPKKRSGPPKPTPTEARARAIAAQLDRLGRAADAADPLEAKRLEEKMRGFEPEVKLLGGQALDPLSKLLADPARSFRARLYAAQFLGSNGDPGALTPLAGRALDPAEPAPLRATALQALGGLRVGAPEKRRVLEQALGADPTYEVRVQALDQLADLGAANPDVILSAAARGLRGPEPVYAVRALAHPEIPRAASKLLDLLPRLRGHEDAEAEALGGLLELPRVDATPAQSRAVVAVLSRRAGRTAVLAEKVAARLALPDATAELRRNLQAPDPEVVTVAAELLAEARDKRGCYQIERLLDNLPHDARFSPKKGVDVSALAARLHAAGELARRKMP